MHAPPLTHPVGFSAKEASRNYPRFDCTPRPMTPTRPLIGFVHKRFSAT